MIESAPSTVNSGQQLTVNTVSAVYSRQQSTAASSSDHSRQRLVAAIQKQETDDVQQIYHVEEGQKTNSSDRALIQPCQGVYGGLSEAERIVMTRRLAEQIQESARRNWISDHQDAVQTDGIRLAEDKVYSQDPMAQRLVVPSHSNPFTNGSHSGAVYVSSDPLGQIRLETAHSGTESQAGLSKQSGSETSPADGKFDSAESQKLPARSPYKGRARGERTPNERREHRKGDVRLERGASSKEGDKGINNTAYHPLLSEDR
jgi:hypothetical protein